MTLWDVDIGLEPQRRMAETAAQPDAAAPHVAAIERAYADVRQRGTWAPWTLALLEDFAGFCADAVGTPPLPSPCFDCNTS